MKFEIVEFYPINDEIKNKEIIGTIHVYFIDIQMDMRGIYVRKLKNKIMFTLPGLKVLDAEGKKVFFPFIEFTDINIKKSLIGFLQKEGIKYIKKNYPGVVGEGKEETNRGICNAKPASRN